jgi:hypothetical protein
VTAYLYFRTIESLIAGRPLLYQNDDRDVYHVSQNGVEVIKSLSPPKTHIMAFVDGDSGDCRPQTFLHSPLVQIVVATSQQGAYQGWVEQASNHTVVTTLATSLWSLHEGFLTGLVLASLLPTLDWFISWLQSPSML